MSTTATIESLLCEHWEGHRDHALLERLAAVPSEWVCHREGQAGVETG